ncbi:DUF3006 domain-containing protein [Paenibacillus yanchengensis]|uniref:DUF3006 domain-containing protein n=1 Tax=Paenibacillus yanchengensis TaxID=2035833 RepID=A0ABW4YIG0_9BACL
MRGIIDRIEGNYYVIEVDNDMLDVEKQLVEQSATAGDVVSWDGSCWKVDAAATKERSQQIKQLMDGLWNDD